MSELIKIGIESSFEIPGSGIAKKLAHHFNTYCVEPYLPEYEKMVQRDIESSDLKRIARGQRHRESEYEAMGKTMLFYDRSMLSLIGWVFEKYGAIDPDITDMLALNAADLYIIPKNSLLKQILGNFTNQPEESVHYYDPLDPECVQKITGLIHQLYPQSQPLSK